MKDSTDFCSIPYRWQLLPWKLVQARGALQRNNGQGVARTDKWVRLIFQRKESRKDGETKVVLVGTDFSHHVDGTVGLQEGVQIPWIVTMVLQSCKQGALRVEPKAYTAKWKEGYSRSWGFWLGFQRQFYKQASKQTKLIVTQGLMR